VGTASREGDEASRRDGEAPRFGRAGGAPAGGASRACKNRIVAARRRGMPVWRDKLFAFLHRNAAPATTFFRIPGNRLVELGAQVEI